MVDAGARADPHRVRENNSSVHNPMPDSQQLNICKLVSQVCEQVFCRVEVAEFRAFIPKVFILYTR
jgi:hypothetical protein